MTSFSVDLAELSAVIDDLTSFQSALDRALDDVERAVTDLHAHWSGEAAAAHQRAHATWTAGAQQMREAVADLHRAAGVAHDNYLGAAEANRRMLAATRG